MLGLLIITIFTIVSVAVYHAVFAFLPSAGLRTIKSLRRINRVNVRPDNSLVRMIVRLVAARVPVSRTKREVLGKKLARVGGGRVEEFVAFLYIRLFFVFLLVPVLYALDIKIAAAAMAILCVGLYYKWLGEPDEKLKKAMTEIEDELPRFVSVLNYSISTDRDLTRAIERYIKIAKPAFRYDLELLLLEMKAGNIADALKRFDSRIGISQLSAFVSGLIDAGRGVDQKTFFYLMEENMNQLFVENRRRELAKKPAKVKKAIIAVGLCLFLVYLVPVCKQLLDGLEMFK